MSIKQMFSWLPGVGNDAPKAARGGHAASSFDAPVFLSEVHRQTGYDREIDEGMSSGFVRLTTIDVSNLSNGELNGLIKGLRKEAQNFNLCKQLQVAGFNKGTSRYLAISGECHMFWQGSVASSFTDRSRARTKGMDVQFKDYVAMPQQQTTDTYEPTNLGRYGTTGAPMFGVSAHPKAEMLRKRGQIQ